MTRKRSGISSCFYAGRTIVITGGDGGIGLATRFTYAAMLRHILKEGREEFIAKIPLGRIGQAEEVASVIEFLCGLSTTYITPRSSM